MGSVLTFLENVLAGMLRRPKRKTNAGAELQRATASYSGEEGSKQEQGVRSAGALEWSRDRLARPRYLQMELKTSSEGVRRLAVPGSIKESEDADRHTARWAARRFMYGRAVEHG